MDSILDRRSDDSYQPKGPFFMGFLFFAGILLPLISFIIEFFSHINAQTFFDPMPTWFHVLLVIFVPLTNLQTWWAIKNQTINRLSWLGFANAVTIFISLYYFIIYIPLLPIAFIALILLLAGLLPMTPMLALLSTLLMRRELVKIGRRQPVFGFNWKGLLTALLVTLVLVGLAEFPFIATRYGLQLALSENQSQQNLGLKIIRNFGSQKYLLEKCYYQSNGVTFDSFSSIYRADRSENTNQVQTIFYRVYGRIFESFPSSFEDNTRVNWFNRINGQISITDDADNILDESSLQLSLSGSQIDGAIHADSAISYFEWTMTFRNDSNWQQEATAQIQLPTDSVVSRVTLWVNGEEREAAFAGRQRVTEAYNAIAVRERRDPLLVNTDGKDKISFRCFPVPSKGEMKIKIGISAPMKFVNLQKTQLNLPHFNQRNFAIRTEHSVWFESKSQLENLHPAFALERTDNLFMVRGKITNSDLAKQNYPIQANRDENVKTSFSKFKDNPSELVKQEIIEKTDEKPAHLVFVVDTSVLMDQYRNGIEEAIKTVPPEIETSLVLTDGNGLNPDKTAPVKFVDKPEKLAETIKSVSFGGGTDSVSALETATDLASQKPNSAILWLHSPQKIQLNPVDSLKQRLWRRPINAPIYNLPISNQRDVVEKALDGFARMRNVRKINDWPTDLKTFISGLNHPQSRFTVTLTTDKTANLKNLKDARETTSHLVRIWANEEVHRLIQKNEDQAALDIAVKNQIVTSVSGAVVLETQEQYDRFELNPGETKNTPSVPEPATLFLFAAGILIIVWLARRWKFS